MKNFLKIILFVFLFHFSILTVSAIECEYKCVNGDTNCEKLAGYMKLVINNGKASAEKRNVNGTIPIWDYYNEKLSFSNACPSSLYACMSEQTRSVTEGGGTYYLYTFYPNKDAASSLPNQNRCYDLTEEKVDVNKAYTCDYTCEEGEACSNLASKFQLQINQEEKKITGLKDSTMTGSIIIDESLEREWFDENNKNTKTCQNFYACMLRYDMPEYQGGTFYQYYFYADSASASNIANHDNCYTVTYASNKEVLRPEKSEYKCKTLENRINAIETKYIEIKTLKGRNQPVGKQYQDLNQTIEITHKFCNGAYASFTYKDDCVQECINLDQKIADLKNKYENSGDDDNNAKCGLTVRLVSWIMKIIGWLRYIVPVLLIILSILDFMKAIAADSEDEVKKVTGKFSKRLIVAVIIFLLPLALEFLLGIFGIDYQNFCL